MKRNETVCLGILNPERLSFMQDVFCCLAACESNWYNISLQDREPHMLETYLVLLSLNILMHHDVNDVCGQLGTYRMCHRRFSYMNVYTWQCRLIEEFVYGGAVPAI